jgi:3'(2'), 5'-bisphosphate nucleotidase
MNEYLPKVIALAEKAAAAVMTIYNSGDFDVQIKSDDSPLTKADLQAHAIISAGLGEFSHFPVLSEEDADIPWSERSQWQTYWLVDPIDGTKEFIRKSDEFTVNIALIDKGLPIMGVVLAPALELLYAADSEHAFVVRDGVRSTLKAKLPREGESLIIVASKSHRSQELEDYLARIPEHTECRAGSSLKLCYIAEGRAHFCPRLGPMNEWDIGAAHAVLLASGAEIVNIDNDYSLFYNQQESLLTPWYRARVKGLQY